MLKPCTRSHSDKMWDIILRCTKVLVASFLQYCVPFWLSYHRKDAVEIMRRQKGFSKMMFEMEGSSYKGEIRKTDFNLTET